MRSDVGWVGRWSGHPDGKQRNENNIQSTTVTSAHNPVDGFSTVYEGLERLQESLLAADTICFLMNSIGNKNNSHTICATTADNVLLLLCLMAKSVQSDVANTEQRRTKTEDG